MINLAELFTDGDAETAVRLATTKGDIDMLLYPSLAPEGVANFMAYVNSGAYDNMAFHRLVPGFVLQGGDLRAVSGPRTFSSIQQLLASPQNEPGISNTRGTVAAAKVGDVFPVTREMVVCRSIAQTKPPTVFMVTWEIPIVRRRTFSSTWRVIRRTWTIRMVVLPPLVV